MLPFNYGNLCLQLRASYALNTASYGGSAICLVVYMYTCKCITSNKYLHSFTVICLITLSII